jgi:hypothetical protein
VSHKGIRLLIEKTVNNLSDDIQFSYATETDFNQSEKKGSILVNLAPLNSVPAYRVNGTTNYMKQWNVELVFYKVDNTSSVEEYKKILDDLDEMVDKFINELNFYSVKADDITLSAFNQASFVKATADVLTGWLLTFQILANDDYDPCRDC